MASIYKDKTPIPQVKSAAYTFVPADDGKLFYQSSATAGWTLPAIADVWDGWNVEIFNEGATSLIVTAPSGKFVGLNNAAATTLTFNTASNIIGAACRVYYSSSRGKYFVVTMGGTPVMS